AYTASCCSTCACRLLSARCDYGVCCCVDCFAEYLYCRRLWFLKMLRHAVFCVRWVSDACKPSKFEQSTDRLDHFLAATLSCARRGVHPISKSTTRLR